MSVSGCVRQVSPDAEYVLLRKSCDTTQDPVRKAFYLLLRSTTIDKPCQEFQDFVGIWESLEDNSTESWEIYEMLEKILLWSGSTNVLQFYFTFYPGEALSERKPDTILEFAMRYPRSFFSLSNVTDMLELTNSFPYAFNDLEDAERIVSVFQAYAESKEELPNRNVAKEFVQMVQEQVKEFKREQQRFRE
jgi:hypothetical protein